MTETKSTFWTRFESRQSAKSTQSVENKKGQLYALLFNGHEGRHSADMELVYESLLHAGCDAQNVFALEGKGSTKNPFVKRPATVRNLEAAIEAIRYRVTPNDRLLVFITNHGYHSYGQCSFQAYGNDVVWERDFEAMTADLPVNYALFYFAQCHSGGFAERMGKENYIGMSNAKKGELSTGYSCGANFTTFLFPDILNEKVSIKRAFETTSIDNAEWLLANELGCKQPRLFAMPETPQLFWQNADPSKLYLGKDG